MNERLTMRTLIALMLIVLFVGPGSAQEGDMEWLRLVPLKSTREDVEKLFGQPETSFPNFAWYESSLGRFSVWYASGKCEVGIRGRQWMVPKGTMVQLHLQSRIVRPPSWFVSNIADYEKFDFQGRIFYSSRGGSIGLQTRTRSTGSEIVESVALEPRTDQERLLCPAKTVKSNK
jgi:hypothetical protein